MRRHAAPLVLPALLLTVLAGCERNPFSPDPAPARPPSLALAPLPVTEADAVAISDNIQGIEPSTGLRRHVPWGTIADPMYASGDPASADYTRVVNFNHTGDAAIWTGHYLAAEAFRYDVTRKYDAAQAAVARDNLERALDGIANLAAVTSPARPDLLARFYVPESSPYTAGIRSIEDKHGSYLSTLNGETVRWFGNTSRDQYSGVFFGLSVAFDMLDPASAADAATRARISDVGTRLLRFLLRNNWNVVMPDGSISTTFVGRADQQLAITQVGRRINPAQFDSTYQRLRAALGSQVGLPITWECFDPHGSYYKFNLDHINLYSLIRLEEPTSVFRSTYLNAFSRLRASSCTGSHQNAHFNMVDRALRGANATRDAATRDYLGLWLTRPRRDVRVDLTAKYAACGTNRACSVIPVDERPTTDFLWQRSPYLLTGGKDGTTALPGIDYVLPYWMARYYGVVTP